MTMLSFALSWFGIAVTVAYWAGVSIILSAVQRIYLEPRLEEKYPLSKSKRELRSAKKGRTRMRPGSDAADSGDVQ